MLETNIIRMLAMIRPKKTSLWTLDHCAILETFLKEKFVKLLEISSKRNNDIYNIWPRKYLDVWEENIDFGYYLYGVFFVPL